MNQIEHREPPAGFEEVFCRYIRRNGKIIYPKNGEYFHFFVKSGKKRE